MRASMDLKNFGKWQLIFSLFHLQRYFMTSKDFKDVYEHQSSFTFIIL